MPTKAKGTDGPKRKQGLRLQDRPFNSKDIEKPKGMWSEVSAIWDETIDMMPEGYFKSGDQRSLQAYAVATASWLVLLDDVQTTGSRVDGAETADSKLERSLRAEVVGLAKTLGILTPLERRMQEERPKGALALLDAHREKAS